MGISLPVLLVFHFSSLLSYFFYILFSDNHFAFMHYFFFGMVLITTFCTMLQTSVHSSSGNLSDIIPRICLSLPLFNHKGFDLCHI